MHSQSKARDFNEFRAWFKKLPVGKKSNEFMIEHKLDGLSIELVYEKGKLVHAITQGPTDGYDLVDHVRGSPSIPLTVKSKDSFSVRGELIMETSTFKNTYVPLGYSVARNTAVGLARKGGKAKDLRVVCYSLSKRIPSDAKKAFPDEDEQLEWLATNGFEVVEAQMRDGDQLLSDLEDIYADLSAKRLAEDPSIKYEIDGLVIKCNHPDLDDLKRKTPKTQVALKFPPMGVSTVLRKVIWQTKGSTYTPVGIFDTVEILGSKVSRANLCNPAFLAELGAYVGAEVLVVKRGDVIPKIEAMLSPVNPTANKKLAPPKECRVCSTPLKGRADRRCWCPNERCPLVVVHQVAKWINVLDVKFFGSTLILGVCMRGLVGSIQDLYDLKASEVAKVNLAGLKDDDGLSLGLVDDEDDEEGTKVRKVGLKVATKALANLKAASENLPIAKLVEGLDIFSIGGKTFQLAAEGIETIDQLFEMDRSTLRAIKGLGEKKVDALLAGLAAREDDIRVIASKVTIAFPSRGTQEARGSVCFTGKMSKPRKDLEAMAVEAGFEIRTGVSAKLTYLVTNDAASGSAKNEAARAKGVTVIDEAAFEAMIR
jgi:DNA ligase (NAD+)